ncbi:MAG: polymerase [Treponema sp.]|nr:polymerase [Treponema sp.]
MGTKKIKPAILAVYFLLYLAGGLYPADVNQGNQAAQGAPDITITGSINWEKGELNFTSAFSLGSAGLKFPSGRTQAEEILGGNFADLVKPLLFSLQADSSSTIGDLIQRGDIDYRALDEICSTAKVTPPNFTADLTRFTGSYSIPLSRLGSVLLRHSLAAEPIRPIIPSPAANYTGIVIIADTLLPVHGRNTSLYLTPCILPKIWDSEMNLIFEKNMLNPAAAGSGLNNIVQYTSSVNIYRSTPSGIDPELAKLVGDHPLLIFADSVFGIIPTDPVIDKTDALLILSNDNNRRLLREGRIAFVINTGMLEKALP